MQLKSVCSSCLLLVCFLLMETHGLRARHLCVHGRRRCAVPIAQDDSSPPPPPSPPAASAFAQSEVPMEQQPTYELRELRNEAFFSWPETEEFGKRLSYVWIPATLLVSLPIALSTYSAAEQLPAALLAANVGGSAILFAFLLRLRVGWGYVSERLNSKETYYEENGASGRGGYVVAKDAELAMRDRLLEKYEVQPPLKRVDSALRIAAISLVTSFILLRFVAAPYDPYEQYGQAYLSRLESDPTLARGTASRICN